MSNSVLDGVRRPERRRLLAAEERARKTGAWGHWERLTFPRGSAGGGWAANFAVAYKNAVFAVLWRTVTGTDGQEYQHLAISSLSGIRPTWHEAQRIKSDIAGPGATAVEVYPPDMEIVDEADMYHLWVLPKPMPVSIFTRRERVSA